MQLLFLPISAERTLQFSYGWGSGTRLISSDEYCIDNSIIVSRNDIKNRGENISCFHLTGVDDNMIRLLFRDPVVNDSRWDCITIKNKISFKFVELL